MKIKKIKHISKVTQIFFFQLKFVIFCKEHSNGPLFIMAIGLFCFVVYCWQWSEPNAPTCTKQVHLNSVLMHQNLKQTDVQCPQLHIYFLLLYFSLFLSIFFVPFLFIFAFCFLLGIVCFSMVLYTYASILGSSFAFMFLIVITFET